MASYSTFVNAPAESAVAITKSDSVNLTTGCRGVYIGGAGDVAVVFANDIAVTFSAVPVGTFMPVAAKRINSTNTTATLMVALY